MKKYQVNIEITNETHSAVTYYIKAKSIEEAYKKAIERCSRIFLGVQPKCKIIVCELPQEDDI
jgi:hypothetical protein